MSIVTEARDIHIARIEADVRQCWLAFHELRPHLQSEDEFVERWRKQMEESYQVVYLKDGDKVVAAAGYRISEHYGLGAYSLHRRSSSFANFSGDGLGNTAIATSAE
jgi:hypothetical protein